MVAEIRLTNPLLEQQGCILKDITSTVTKDRGHELSKICDSLLGTPRPLGCWSESSYHPLKMENGFSKIIGQKHECCWIILLYFEKKNSQINFMQGSYRYKDWFILKTNMRSLNYAKSHGMSLSPSYVPFAFQSNQYVHKSKLIIVNKSNMFVFHAICQNYLELRRFVKKTFV